MLFVAVMIAGSVVLLDVQDVSIWRLGLYFIWTFIAVFSLFFVSYKKGPAPGWHWGDSDESD